MKIQKLKIKNFLTIGEAEIDLDDRGLILIQGENEDDSSANSNGAGKSSIVDAISWCLFGTTARNKTGDGVVNRTAKKDCCVGISLVDEDGKLYTVERYRKHSKMKNALVVFREDSPVPIELTKGTGKETQEVLDGIIGCSEEVFNSAIYFGQEQMPDLPSMNDRGLKVLIEEAAGIEVFDAAYSVARRKLTEAGGKLSSVETTGETLANTLKSLHDNLFASVGERDGFETSRVARRDKILDECKELQSTIDKLAIEAHRQDEAGLLERQAEIKSKIADQDHQMKVLTVLEKDARGIAILEGKLASSIESGSANLKKLIASLANVDSRVGKPCGECGKLYCEHDLEAAKKAAEGAVNAEKERLKPILMQHKEAKKSAAEALSKVEKIRSSMPSMGELTKKQTEIDYLLSKIAGIKMNIERLEREIENKKVLAENVMKEKNPFDALVDSNTKKIKECNEKIAENDKSKEIFKREEKIAASVSKIFSPAGVRAHILDTVTPFLNERTSDYLSALSDGNIHAVWTTLTKNAAGELREKFTIEASNDKGDDSFAGLSGGEKRKVRLACAMALQDLVSSRATKPINLLVADEVDHALDEAGLERLMGVLEKKARDRGTVIVISHNSLSDWIPEAITVKKSGGFSTVTGATKRV